MMLMRSLRSRFAGSCYLSSGLRPPAASTTGATAMAARLLRPGAGPWACARSFAGNEVSDAPAAAAESDFFAQVVDVEKRSRFRNVFDSLHVDPRVKMPFNEYLLLCDKNGVSQTEAQELATSLHNCGLIWYFPGYFEEQQPLLLKPKETTHAFLSSLDLDSNLRHQFVRKKRKQLEGLLADIAGLEKQHDEIETRARLFAKRCWQGFFGYVVGHCMLVPYLTFWRLSWDIMEPVTYMFNLWTLFMATWFYRKTNFEFTYESINESIIRMRRETLYRKLSFDIEAYERLQEEIEDVQDALLNPEWHMLLEVQPDLPDTVKVINSSPRELLDLLEDLQKKAKKA